MDKTLKNLEEQFVYLNSQSLFNIEMKNEKQILAVAHFFL